MSDDFYQLEHQVRKLLFLFHDLFSKFFFVREDVSRPGMDTSILTHPDLLSNLEERQERWERDERKKRWERRKQGKVVEEANVNC